MKHYWMHRISHEWEVSYPLLDRGFLTYGWSEVSGNEALQAARDDTFRAFCDAAGITQYRSRWNIWYCAQYKPGDMVVVPLFDGLFQIFEITAEAQPIAELGIARITDRLGKQIVLRDGLLHSEEDGEGIDLGFFCRVKPLGDAAPRSAFADAPLTSRMKMRQTCGDITDIGGSVEAAVAAIQADRPINFYEEVRTELAEALLKKIDQILPPDKVEVLVKLYFEKMGATNVYIPSKNEAGKKEGADADVVAEFEQFKTVFYVQVKKYSGTTSSWAVEQIEKYVDQMGNSEDDYTYIPWVISTAEDFSEDAKNLVKQASGRNIFIRLINGIEFAKMLVDSGLTGFERLT